MNLSYFEIHLGFSKKHKVATPASAIFRALTGKQEPSGDKPIEPGVRIRDEQQKQLIFWHYNSCTVLYEDRQDYDFCINGTVNLLDRIDKIAPIRELELMRFRADWILPVVNYDFKSLEQKYREHFIKQHAIFDNCYDSSVVIYMKRNKWTLHHQSGAMNIDQLQRDYRVFPMEKTKDKLFLFLSNKVESTETIIYSNKQMKGFLDEAFKMCKNHSELFQSMMEGIL